MSNKQSRATKRAYNRQAGADVTTAIVLIVSALGLLLLLRQVM